MQYSEYDGTMHVVAVGVGETCVAVLSLYRGLAVDPVCGSVGGCISSISPLMSSGRVKLRSVVLPDSAGEIGGHVFRGCPGSSGISAPESLASVSLGTFDGSPEAVSDRVRGRFSPVDPCFSSGGEGR